VTGEDGVGLRRCAFSHYALCRCAFSGQPFPPQLLDTGADRLEIVSCSGP
jgi:hypothetical protein